MVRKAYKSINSRFIVGFILTALLVASGQENNGQQVQHSGATLILTITVLNDKFKYVSPLDKSAFTVFDGKSPLQVMTSNMDAPASIFFVLDLVVYRFESLYGQQNSKRIGAMKEAMSEFLKISNPSNDYTLIAFSRDSQHLLRGERDKGAVVAALEQVTSIKAKRPRSFYDTLASTAEEAKRSAQAKRVIIVVCSGFDGGSSLESKDLRRLMKESDSILYPVLVPVPPETFSGMFWASERAFLEQIASASGGRAFYASTSVNLSDILTNIAAELRYQYSVEVKLANPINDASWHRIRVKVTPPRGEVLLPLRHREGYIAGKID